MNNIKSTEAIMNRIREILKRKMPLLLTFTVYCLLLTVNCNAAFEETAVGGRPTAMGGAYVGLADDVYSIYHNPAGLALMPQAEFAAQYSKLFVGLTDDSNLN